MRHASIAFQICLLLHALAFASSNALAQSVGSEPATAYFEQQVRRLAEQTSSDLARVTPENWDATRAQWRQELQEMLGLNPLPKRTDLETTIVGSLHQDGVSIDRLHYQSRPGLYVAANFYRPSGPAPDGGWPAVLYVCGHSRSTDYGRLLGNKTGYQHHGLWLASHGVACLMIDTVQLGELHGEHHGTYRLGRWDWISRGYTPAGVEAWNAIRGIDLLTSLPDINANRIGITGRSGGGAYSWFAAALDERIHVTVPVAGITDLQNHVLDGCVEGHCDCMYFVNYHRWDYAKLAALVAPRALLLENSDSDGIFPLDGVVRIDRQLRNLYQQLGAAENYGLVITPGPHQDSQDLQVPAFRWLLKHLTGVEPVVDSAAEKTIEPQQLAVFERETPRDERVTSLANWFVPAATALDDSDEALSNWTDKWLPELQRLGSIPTEIEAPTFEALASGQDTGRDWQLLRSTAQQPIRILRVGDGTASQRPPVIHLVLSQPATDDATWDTPDDLRLSASVVQSCEAQPNRVHYFVQWRGARWLRDAGNVKAQTHLARRFYLVGQTPESVALNDFLCALRWLSTNELSDVACDLEASGRATLLVTLAALTAQSRLTDFQLDTLHLNGSLEDPHQTAVLPGLARVCHPLSLVRAASAVVNVKTSEDFDATAPSAGDQQLLIDSKAAPEQANGLKIVEVSQQRAKVWVRATRWPLPNLGDLPPVTFEKPNGKRSSGSQLPPGGAERLPFAAPGVAAEVRVGHRQQGSGDFQYTEWRAVDASSDFSALVDLESLRPNTAYDIRTQTRALATPNAEPSTTSGPTAPVSTFGGSFRTLPSETEPASAFKLAVSTCQEFPDSDGPHGFDQYRTMLRRGTDAFVMAGDVVYYDTLARNKQLAYYHWQRTYSLPTLVEFHRRVPSYFLKDDHDTYVDDTWPGKSYAWTEKFTFEDGQAIFPQLTGLPSPAYRTFSIGSELQVWLMEGRDFRSPNNIKDGPEKTIWGAAQKQWLSDTLKQSTAKFKVVISPTPLVGPDRNSKSDNHSNAVFATEGQEVRALLASIPNTVSVCGDRHWQFHSIDPESKLHEFSVGPASDRHAGGWKQSDFRPDIHQYLRVGGGYLEIELDANTDAGSQLILRHLDSHGKEHHRHTLR